MTPCSGDFVGPFVPSDEGVGQEWTRLQAFLASHGLAFDLREPPRQFSGGFGNLNYLIKVDNAPAVLRRPPAGPVPPGANDMRREYSVLRHLWRAYEQAPRALHFCDDADVLGAPFLILEYRPGRIIRGELPEDLGRRPEVGTLLSDMMIELLARLHALNPADVMLSDFGRPQGFLARTLDGWRKRADLVVRGPSSALCSSIIGYLRDRIVPDQPPALLHGDFKLDNIILEPRTLAPVAVLDWDLATRGDPLLDLAVLLSYWSDPDDPPAMQQLRQMPTASGSFRRRSDALQQYAELTGRSIDSFVFYRVLAMFRLGIVFLQLYDRYQCGVTTDARFAGFGSLGHALLEFTHEITRGRAE
ncbi:MAG: phosphotransferase family protein [Hyphomicrobiaceae bacterium]